MLMKLLITLYPILIFTVIAIFFNFFRIRKHLPLNVPDVVTFFLIFGLHYFSRQVTHVSILPYYLLLISAMALILLLLDLFYYREFRAKSSSIFSGERPFLSPYFSIFVWFSSSLHLKNGSGAKSTKL